MEVAKIDCDRILTFMPKWPFDFINGHGLSGYLQSTDKCKNALFFESQNDNSLDLREFLAQKWANLNSMENHADEISQPFLVIWATS